MGELHAVRNFRRRFVSVEKPVAARLKEFLRGFSKQVDIINPQRRRVALNRLDQVSGNTRSSVRWQYGERSQERIRREILKARDTYQLSTDTVAEQPKCW